MTAPAKIEIVSHVQKLIARASGAERATDAMQLAQAALSAAHAMRMTMDTLQEHPALQKSE